MGISPLELSISIYHLPSSKTYRGLHWHPLPSTSRIIGTEYCTSFAALPFRQRIVPFLVNFFAVPALCSLSNFGVPSAVNRISTASYPYLISPWPPANTIFTFAPLPAAFRQIPSQNAGASHSFAL